MLQTSISRFLFVRHKHLADTLRTCQSINLQPAATPHTTSNPLHLEAMADFSEVMRSVQEGRWRFTHALTLQTPLVETKLNTFSMRGCLQSRPNSRPIDVPATDIFVASMVLRTHAHTYNPNSRLRSPHGSPGTPEWCGSRCLITL